MSRENLDRILSARRRGFSNTQALKLIDAVGRAWETMNRMEALKALGFVNDESLRDPMVYALLNTLAVDRSDAISWLSPKV